MKFERNGEKHFFILFTTNKIRRKKKPAANNIQIFKTRSAIKYAYSYVQIYKILKQITLDLHNNVYNRAWKGE